MNIRIVPFSSPKSILSSFSYLFTQPFRSSSSFSVRYSHHMASYTYNSPNAASTPAASATALATPSKHPSLSIPIPALGLVSPSSSPIHLNVNGLSGPPTATNASATATAAATTTTASADDRSDYICWVDTELTGLDPSIHSILEISILLTDASLNPVDEGLTYVLQNSLSSLSEWCEKNLDPSLLSASKISKISSAYVESSILNYLQKHRIPLGKIPLAGNSVHVDKLFLRKEMPFFIDYLHYRIIDVSTIKELCRRWNKNIAENAPKKKGKHRTLDDVQESINELKYYRDNFLNTTENTALVPPLALPFSPLPLSHLPAGAAQQPAAAAAAMLAAALSPRPLLLNGPSAASMCEPAKSDQIFLEDLSFYSFHGYYTNERSDGQIFTVDCTLSYNSRKCAKSDDLAFTIDYDFIYEEIERCFCNHRPHFFTLESLAQLIISRLFYRFSVDIDKLKQEEKAISSSGKETLHELWKNEAKKIAEKRFSERQKYRIAVEDRETQRRAEGNAPETASGETALRGKPRSESVASNASTASSSASPDRPSSPVQTSSGAPIYADLPVVFPYPLPRLSNSLTEITVKIKKSCIPYPYPYKQVGVSITRKREEFPEGDEDEGEKQWAKATKE